MLTTSVFEKMMWTDNRLVWNKDDFDGIDRIQVNADEVRKYLYSLKYSLFVTYVISMLNLLLFNKNQIWKPDITLYNAIEAPKMMYSHVEEPFNAVIFNNGIVVFIPFMQFKVSLLIRIPKNVTKLQN